MAQLEPYKCKHCSAKTEKHSTTYIRFTQTVYEQSYGRLYPKDGNLVDYGPCAVFLCNKCTRRFVSEKYSNHGWLGFVFCTYALLVLYYALNYLNSHDGTLLVRFLCVLAVAGFFLQIFMEDVWDDTFAGKVTRHLPSQGTYYGRKEAKAFARYSGNKSTYFLFGGVATLAGVILSIFMLSSIYSYYIYVLMAVIALMWFFWLGLILRAWLKKNGGALNRTRAKAVEYYFYVDDGIRLQ